MSELFGLARGRSQGGSRCTARLGLALTLAVIGLLALPSVGSTAPGNDTRASATPIGLREFHVTQDTEDFTIQTDEPLTANDPTPGDGCTPNGTQVPGGVQMGRTLWYAIVGTGGPITVDTFGSDFDTVLAIYQASNQAFITCDDQANGPSGTLFSNRSRVTFPSTLGATYQIQIGGFDDPDFGPDFGLAEVFAYEPNDAPANDDRADA